MPSPTLPDRRHPAEGSLDTPSKGSSVDLVPRTLAERRRLLQGVGSLASATALQPLLRGWPAMPALAALAAAPLTSALTGCASTPGAIGNAAPSFKPVAPATTDQPVLPPGYTAQSLAAWGEPVGLLSSQGAGASASASQPAFKPDASNTAAEQAQQVGTHHGGLQYVPLDGSQRGLLVMNHGGADEGLLHPRGTAGWSADKVQKSQAAQGISVLEVALKGKAWQPVRPSRLARRITANTPVTLSGPAAGHALLQTRLDPSGRRALGALARGGVSITPWGTCLMGEEGFAGCFSTADTPTQHERRWGLRRLTGSSPVRWHEFDERFDTVRHTNEPNRFGWILEFDPQDPGSMPMKRTALGRGAHAGAWASRSADGRAVVYSGECAAFEHLYKFVSRDPIRPARGGQTAAQANADLLDHGTLHVARFEADGTGRWLPLVHGQGPLTAANGFADAAEVLVKTRQACDLLGATRMDRPESLALDAASGWVYAALAHNPLRGTADHPGLDAANPRPRNAMGHILRWREVGTDRGTDRFVWNHLLLAGDPAAARPEHRGNVKGDAFACPAALALDPRGALWIGTGVPAAAIGQAEMARLGNNQLLACNPATGEVRRFLSGPVNAELAGAAFTPDGSTVFVNVRHPGASPLGAGDPGAPRRFSNWPDFQPNGRPRSATLAVRRSDGGVVGG